MCVCVCVLLRDCPNSVRCRFLLDYLRCCCCCLSMANIFSRIAKWMWHHGWLTTIYDQINVCSNQKKSHFIHEQSITNRFHRHTSRVLYTLLLHYTVYVASATRQLRKREHMYCTRPVTKRNRKAKQKKNTRTQYNNSIVDWLNEKHKMRKAKLWCPKKKREKKSREDFQESNTHTHARARINVCKFLSFLISPFEWESDGDALWNWENVHADWCKSPRFATSVRQWFGTIPKHASTYLYNSRK